MLPSPESYSKDKRVTLDNIVFPTFEDNSKSIIECLVISPSWFYLLGSGSNQNPKLCLSEDGMFKLIAGATEETLTER
jgi:hypothetical protein